MSAVGDARKRAQEAQGGSEGVQLTDDERAIIVRAVGAIMCDYGTVGDLLADMEQIIAARLAAHAPAQAPGSVPVAPVPDEGAEGREIGAERLAEWRQLADEATDGPWWAAGRWFHGEDDGEGWPCIGHGRTGADVVGHAANEADATFIAAARTAVPALLDEVERLHAERDYHRARADVFKAKVAGGVALRSGKRPGDYWAEWHETHCAAAQGAARERRRAEAAEAQLADLRARVGALADEWAELDGGSIAGSYRAGEYAWAFAPVLRALLAPEAEGSED